MGLSSALFAGSSGLTTLGNAMQIIGDNIANINTYGYKRSNFSFQDLLSQSVATMSGTSQIGSGTALGSVYASFEQGSFETTSNATDLAIGGDGFFTLRENSSQSKFYTRAGNFRFDKDGYLSNPEGYIVQGWKLDDNGNDTGSVTDIKLESFTSSPQKSEKIRVILNLNSEGTDNSIETTPTTTDDALKSAWDGTASPPLADNEYEYQTAIEVYDSLGSTHDITFYFDKADADSAIEFIVTCNPGEDKRAGVSTSDTHAGLLARGILKFNPSSGVITDIDLWQIDGTGGETQQLENSAGHLKDGYFTFNADFLGVSSPMSIKLDFGAKSDGSDSGASWINDSSSTTQFAKASNTIFKSSDGYGAGDLQDINVDVDGVITGSYSNGQLMPLYRVALSDFQNNQGLYKQGGNLYKETRASGNATTNKPGTNGLGKLAPNSLEQSNVDISAEFVRMITTQRGFQANSKIITITDQMMGDLINLKR